MKGSRLAALLGLGGVILGCAGALPPTHYYVLRPSVAAASASLSGSADGLDVGVESFAVDPPYDQDRIVYRRGADSAEVGFYAYHRWASHLGRLVQVALAEGLRGTPGIAAIEPATSTGDYSARLAGRVVYVETVESESGQEARVSLVLELTDGHGHTLWSGTASGAAAGQAASAGELVGQIRRAFESALAKARGDLARALSG